MTRLVSYARTMGGHTGSSESLSFWRRIRIPFSEMQRQHWFSSFQVMTMPHPDLLLTTGQLLGPEAVLLHNFEPVNRRECEVFAEAAASSHLGGRIPLWVYDLEEPVLLHSEYVQAILPLMQLITVPNEYLRQEVHTLSRGMLQRVEILPSTFDMPWLRSAMLSPEDGNELLDIPPDEDKKQYNLFVVSCYGDHDWHQLFPSLFDTLNHLLSQEEQLRFVIQTDNKAVVELCKAANIGVEPVFPSPMVSANYPAHLGRCDVALCPREGKDGRDTCWVAEYGAVGVPSLIAYKSAYDTPEFKGSGSVTLDIKKPEDWGKVLAHWMKTKEGMDERDQRAKQALLWATERRVQIAIGRYNHLYRQILPASLS